MIRIFIMLALLFMVVGYISMVIIKKYHQLKTDEEEYNTKESEPTKE